MDTAADAVPRRQDEPADSFAFPMHVVANWWRRRVDGALAPPGPTSRRLSVRWVAAADGAVAYS